MLAYPTNHTNFVGKRLGMGPDLPVHIWSGTADCAHLQSIQLIHISFPLISHHRSSNSTSSRDALGGLLTLEHPPGWPTDPGTAPGTLLPHRVPLKTRNLGFFATKKTIFTLEDCLALCGLSSDVQRGVAPIARSRTVRPWATNHLCFRREHPKEVHP